MDAHNILPERQEEYRSLRERLANGEYTAEVYEALYQIALESGEDLEAQNWLELATQARKRVVPNGHRQEASFSSPQAGTLSQNANLSELGGIFTYVFRELGWMKVVFLAVASGICLFDPFGVAYLILNLLILYYLLQITESSLGGEAHLPEIFNSNFCGLEVFLNALKVIVVFVFYLLPSLLVDHCYGSMWKGEGGIGLLLSLVSLAYFALLFPAAIVTLSAGGGMVKALNVFFIAYLTFKLGVGYMLGCLIGFGVFTGMHAMFSWVFDRKVDSGLGMLLIMMISNAFIYYLLFSMFHMFGVLFRRSGHRVGMR